MSKKKIDVVGIHIGVTIGLILMLIIETIYLSVEFGSYSAACENAHEIESNLTNVIDEVKWYSETWWYGVRGF